MKKLLAFLLSTTIGVSQAFAGTSTIAVTPGSGSTYQVITNGSSNFVGMFGLCDGVAAAQCVAVKAASTAAVATDPAIVVAISPNNTVAATQSGSWNLVNISGTVSLPTGAATAAGLTTINTTLGSPFQAGGSIGNTTFAATQATAASLNATVVGTGTFATQLTGATNNINNIAGTITLPTGAATSALQTTGNTSLTTINTTLGTPMQNSGGSVTANAGTNLNTSALATSANQTNASQKTQIVDGSGNVIASTSNNLDVQCANCSGSGVSTADGSTWTVGTSLFAGIGGFFQTTPTTNPLTTGHQGFAQLTANRALFTDWYNSSGTEMGTSSSPVQVSVANTGANGTAIAVTAAQGTAANLNATVVGTGTFAAQLTGATNNINNISGTISLPTGAATSANQPTNAAQASTTSGQTGNLHLGAVTTAAPSYTTGQTDPISLDLAGNIRVNCTTGCSASTSITSWAGGTLGAMANYGTSPGAVLVPGVNAFVTNVPAVSQSGTWTSRIVGNAGAIMDFAGQNASSPANSLLIGGQFNTSPTTITSGNVSPFQLDNAGNLLVNIKAGGGSGGTSAADGTAWAVGTTAQTPIGCEFTTGGATVLSTAHMGTVGCTTARAIFTDKSSVAGTALSAAVSAYGTAPTGTEVEGVNAFVTNTNPNGSTTSANSSPIVIASDQAAVAVKAASGAFASGSIASGALAAGSISAGAYVSGSVLSGAYASGSLASGAVVDLTNIEGVIGAATAPTKMSVGGVVYNSGGVTLTNGQSAAVQSTAQGMQIVVPGNTTITGTSWNSSTGTNGTTQTIINANAYASAYLVQLDQTTTITAGAITFQVSGDGGANWTTINAYQVVDPTSASGATISLPYTLVASTNKQFLIYPQGMAVRMEVSTTMTGTGAFQPFVTPLPMTQNVALLPGANAVGTTTLGAGSANAGAVEVYDAGGTNKLNVVATSTAPVTASNTAVVVDLRPDSPGIITLGPATTANSIPVIPNSQYPANSVTTTPTPAVAKSTGTTGAVTGTIAAVASATNYLCGFDVSAIGGIAAVGPITVTGLLGGTWTYQLTSTASGVTLSKEFNMCVPASGTNVAISVVTTADGTATAVDVNLHGYTQ